MKIEKRQNGGWFIYADGQLIGGFREEKYADMFMEAVKNDS